jgi:hypothetical protein
MNLAFFPCGSSSTTPQAALQPPHIKKGTPCSNSPRSVSPTLAEPTGFSESASSGFINIRFHNQTDLILMGRPLARPFGLARKRCSRGIVRAVGSPRTGSFAIHSSSRRVSQDNSPLELTDWETAALSGRPATALGPTQTASLERSLATGCGCQVERGTSPQGCRQCSKRFSWGVWSRR